MSAFRYIFWSFFTYFLFFPYELALLLLASQTTPILLRRSSWKSTHSWQCKCLWYCYIIILHLLHLAGLPGCFSVLCRGVLRLSSWYCRHWLHSAGQWAEGGKGLWLLPLLILGVLFQTKSNFISLLLGLLTTKQSMWNYWNNSIYTRGN